MKKGYSSGVFNGICSAAMWGADTVLLSVFLPGDTAFLAPFITTFFHDSFSAVWTFLYLLFRRQLGNLTKALKTKSALYVALAALMGGPIGMTGYLFAVKLIGPSYTAIISSLYPAVGAFLSYVILKDKLNKKAWIGLIAVIVGIGLLGFTPSNGSLNLPGVLCASLCVIGWGSECVICAYGMKDKEVTSELALQIRQLTSGLTYGFLIIPIVGGLGLTAEMAKSNIIFGIGITALTGTISYLCYYAAIYKIGPTRAMGINITYVIWTIAINMFRGEMPSVIAVLSSILVISGVYFVAKEPEPELKENKSFI
ncbi:DMT family transporter [Clostridium sp. BJN0001]|uniref:DMT family transporter n=1 Tax=Clostridium sp. BJN0001 TaxID=2930219 RepID=UPI001FD4190E|nr:DMT family transporter [Clostridium sp. BJN0001]